MKYGGLLVCWLLGSAAVITIYWLHFIIRSAVSQRSPFSIRPVVSLAGWWAVLLFVIVCSSAYSCSYPTISSPVSINQAHAPLNGFLSSDAMTVHSETSACSTNMCHREGVPSAPPPTSHQEERCSHLPLDTADTRDDWCLVSPLLCAHQGSWNCVGAARHLQHCGQQQGTLSSPLQSADLKLQHYSLYSYRAITEGERLLQCCSAARHAAIYLSSVFTAVSPPHLSTACSIAAHLSPTITKSFPVSSHSRITGRC